MAHTSVIVRSIIGEIRKADTIANQPFIEVTDDSDVTYFIFVSKEQYSVLSEYIYQRVALVIKESNSPAGTYGDLDYLVIEDER